MRIGKLNKRIRVQRPILSSDNYGGQDVDNWRDVMTVFANIRPLSYREELMAAQAGQTVTHIITIRYTAFVESDWRIILADQRQGERTFQVDSCKAIKGERRFLEIKAIERRE